VYIVGWPRTQNGIPGERIPEAIFTPEVLDRFANLLMVGMRRRVPSVTNKIKVPVLAVEALAAVETGQAEGG
jgi:hypothetical protein